MKQKLNNEKFDVLNEAISLQQQAINFGFNWPNIDLLIKQIISECKEIEQACKNECDLRIQEEIGDLLQAAISLCIFNGFDVKQTILQNNDKFRRRLKTLKTIAKNRGFDNLHQQPIEFLITLWKETKNYR